MFTTDLVGFILFFVGLSLYLLWSAKTEMGTKFGQKNKGDRRSGEKPRGKDCEKSNKSVLGS